MVKGTLGPYNYMPEDMRNCSFAVMRDWLRRKLAEEREARDRRRAKAAAAIKKPETPSEDSDSDSSDTASFGREPSYEFDAILDKKYEHDRPLYLVAWKGNHDPSWVRPEDFTDPLHVLRYDAHVQQDCGGKVRFSESNSPSCSGHLQGMCRKHKLLHDDPPPQKRIRYTEDDASSNAVGSNDNAATMGSNDNAAVDEAGYTTPTPTTLTIPHTSILTSPPPHMSPIKVYGSVRVASHDATTSRTTTRITDEVWSITKAYLSRIMASLTDERQREFFKTFVFVFEYMAGRRLMMPRLPDVTLDMGLIRELVGSLEQFFRIDDTPTDAPPEQQLAHCLSGAIETMSCLSASSSSVSTMGDAMSIERTPTKTDTIMWSPMEATYSTSAPVTLQCYVCLEEVSPMQAIGCAAHTVHGEDAEIHTMCNHCLQHMVESWAKRDHREALLVKQKGVLHCQAPGCGAHLEEQQIALHTSPEVFERYVANRLRVVAGEQLLAQEETFRKELQQQMETLDDESASARYLERLKAEVIDIMATACPSCGQHFHGFLGCFALHCDAYIPGLGRVGCGKYFCAWCFTAFGTDKEAHDHLLDKKCQGVPSVKHRSKNFNGRLYGSERDFETSIKVLPPSPKKSHYFERMQTYEVDRDCREHTLFSLNIKLHTMYLSLERMQRTKRMQRTERMQRTLSVLSVLSVPPASLVPASLVPASLVYVCPSGVRLDGAPMRPVLSTVRHFCDHIWSRFLRGGRRREAPP